MVQFPPWPVGGSTPAPQGRSNPNTLFTDDNQQFRTVVRSQNFWVVANKSEFHAYKHERTELVIISKHQSAHRG